MKRIVLLLTSAVFLLAGCAKENLAPSDLGEGLQTVTFTAAVEDGVATKAVADGDGAAASVNRCIMEVYYCDSLFTRMYAPVNSQKKASFTLQMVSNRTYKVAFWADHVDNATTEAGLVVDKYYTTNATGGLQAIALKGTYAGNDDSRDAFYHVGNYEVKQGGSAFSDVKLKRPFAQMNVITTDWNVVSKVGTLKPEKVNVTLKNPMVKFNAVTGVASADSGVPTLNYEAALYTSPAPVQPVSDTVKTLSMDYLFASETKEMIDIDWKATKANNADVAHTFAAVPYQRNYRTNIKGALLTTTGQWNVTVDPIWESSKPGNKEIEYIVVADIAGANDVINNAITAGQSEISVKFKSEPNDAGTPGATSGDVTSKAIVTTKLPEDSKLNILIEAQTNDLYIGDYTSETNTTVVTTGTEEAVVNLNIPVSSGIKKLIINAPSKTVYLNGVQVANTGVIDDLDATVSNNTLVIEKGQIVKKLTIRKGGLEIHGTVETVVVPENTPKEQILVRACEGLSASVFGVLEKYIDAANGWTSKANGTDPETYDIIKINEWQYFAAKTFSQISGKDITITSAEELALFAKENGTYKTYNITLGCDIDLSAHIWNPIPSFQGNFDGNNKTITGLKITGVNDYVGLFGSMDGSEALGTPATYVKNLTIKGADIQGKDYVGTLTGFAGYDRTITNVIIDGCKVVGTKYVGGIAGDSIDDYTNCEVIGGTVSGVDQVGGMMGQLWGGSIENCRVSGTVVTSSSERAGGLVGKINLDKDNGSWIPIINGNTVTAIATAPDMAGGIAAQLMGDMSNYQIKNNTIDVTMTAPKTSPIAVLRSGQETAFTSKLAENIVENTWTSATLDSDCYTYTAAETGAGDQIIWNGTAPEPLATIGDKVYYKLDKAIADAIKNNDGVPVKIIRDITFDQSANWTPVVFGSATLVIDGANHTITNLPGMLLKGNAGGWSLTVKDVTFENPKAEDDFGAAVICGYADASNIVKFSNVKINKAIVTSPGQSNGEGGYAAGFIAYSAGYGESSLGSFNFENCEVTNSTLTGFSSTGALMGHATANENYGKVVVTGTKVTGNTITVTELNKKNKAGALFGTVGTAPQGAYVSATVSDNTVTSDGQVITTIYGRGAQGGKLYLTEGGSYSAKPIADTDASWAGCQLGYILKDKGTYWTVEKLDKSNIEVSSLAELNTMINAFTETGDYVYKLPAGNFVGSEVHILQREGVNVTIQGSNTGVTSLSQAQIIVNGGGRSSGQETLTIKDITFDYSAYTANTGIDIIQANKVTPSYNYDHNITVDHCIFIGNSANRDKIVAVRLEAAGGHYNFSLKNCTAENLHSLAQLTSVSGVTITGCTLTSCGRGVNLNSSTSVLINDNNWTISDYLIRAGQSSAGDPNYSSMKIYGNIFKKTSAEDGGCLVLRNDCCSDIIFCDNAVTFDYAEGDKYDVYNKKNLNADTTVKTDNADINVNDHSKLTVTKGTWDKSTKTFTPAN